MQKYYFKRKPLFETVENKANPKVCHILNYYSFRYLFFKCFQFMRKNFHILANFLFRYLGVNLCGLYIAMSHHPTDYFFRNSL